MTYSVKQKISFQTMRRLAIVLAFAYPAFAVAGLVNLTTVPLANSTTTKVLPNLMLIQDNSGSMNWDYVPDWVVDGNYCKGGTGATSMRCCRDSAGTAIGSNSDTDVCMPNAGNANLRGMPPFMSSDFNGVFYNPAVTYKLPVNADGTNKVVSYGTDYNAVPYDGYNKQTTTKVDLKSAFPDIEWCTDATYTDCLRNDNYLVPGTVNSKSYTVMHGTTSPAGSTAQFATGTSASPTATSRSLGPYYYVIVPGEYCKAADLTDCVTASGPSGLYIFPAPVRWCSDVSLSICKETQDSTYKYPKYPTIKPVAGAGATGKITVASVPKASASSPCNAATTNSVNVTSVKLNGTELLASSFYYCSTNNTQSTRNTGLATAIAAAIGNGFTASSNNAVVTISTPQGTTYNGATLGSTLTNGATVTVSTAFAGGATEVVVPGSFVRVDIVSSQTYGNVVVGGTTIVDRSNRTDCAARPNCTYAEELANFANWVAWYRSRTQMMKSTLSLAFQPIGNNFRVGFYTINNPSSNYLAVSKFNSAQKTNWYSKLFAFVPSGGTPLRSTLSNVGKIFAGQYRVNSTDEDPMEYSCQQNFALLTTDGYWNTDSTAETGNTSVTGLKAFGSSTSNQVGDNDSVALAQKPDPYWEGATTSANTLADVAAYYYQSDLRSSTKAGYNSTTTDNCTVTGKDDDTGISYTRNVCDNNVSVSGNDNLQTQHMTTFTLGLGVNGTLQYQSDYDSASSGDYYNIKMGTGSPTLYWPKPTQDTSTAVDDLWHAAVNGHGRYFSAKNPSTLSQGLNTALANIAAKIGAGAAAATSTLNPVQGDNYAYVASYISSKWTGNLERRSINTTDGTVSETAQWCLEDVVAGSCVSPSLVVSQIVGNSTITYCKTPSASVCTGTMVGADCFVEMSATCKGTMLDRVSPTDTRTIKVSSGTALVEFDATFASNHSTYFDSTALSGLSQWASLSSAQKSAAVGATILKYLRGQKDHEDTSSNPLDDRLFRYREAVIGDIVDSQPAFIGKPTFSYVDAGYSAFVSAQASREGTVYFGGNDGMLHAINATNGQERWAYVPTPVLPNLWRLADSAYGTGHRYFVDGSPTISDICTANCTDATTAVWKTILVGGLGGGGRGFYALDITSPASPSLLWEFTNTNDNDLGYSYGNPVVTKKTDGTWVVLLTSGYNNAGVSASDGNGQGYLYVVNAATGALISKTGTGVGSTSTPSGLSKIAVWADSAEKNNVASSVYGGDLLGNLWRFDINASPASVTKFAVLRDPSGVVQPITSRPELGNYSSQHVVFVATGKYLESSDLTDTQIQTLYAIKDNGSATTLDTPRTATGTDAFVQQTLTTTGTTRTSSNNALDWTSKRGWYVDLDGAKTGEGSERVGVNMQLVSGTLLVASVVPASTDCSPGGYSWLNYFDYATGGAVGGSGAVSSLVSSPIVGFNVMYIAGKPVVDIVTANNPTPVKQLGPKFGSSSSGFQGKRVIWRELLQ